METTETEEIETVTWPVCVNPNFSKRIIGRASSEMTRDLISAIEGGTTTARKRRMKTTERGIFVIVTLEGKRRVGRGLNNRRRSLFNEFYTLLLQLSDLNLYPF